jgi:glutaredoxin 3
MFCGFCTAAKNLLKKCGVKFEEIDAGMDPNQHAEMVERSGTGTFPQVFIDGKHVGDCEYLYAFDASGELDKLIGEQRFGAVN